MNSPDLTWLVPYLKVSLGYLTITIFSSYQSLHHGLCVFYFKNCFPTLKDTNFFKQYKIALLTYKSLIHLKSILDHTVGSDPIALFPHVQPIVAVQLIE